MVTPLIIIAVILFVIVSKGTVIIRPYQKGIVERFGKYQHTVDSGLSIIVPYLDKIIKIDMREQVLDISIQAITKDDVVVEVVAMLSYEITNPVKVMYNISNLNIATTKIAQISLRNLIGDLTLNESLTSREKIIYKLREILDDATDNWGARITRVELQRIEPRADSASALRHRD